MASENSIEQAFVRWCEKMGLDCPKLNLRSGRGWPDRCVLLPHNRVVWIEFKTPNGKLSPQQEFCIRRLEKHGHDVHVCRSTEEAIKVVEMYLCN